MSDDPRFQMRPRVRFWDNAASFGCQYEPMTLTIYEVYMSDESTKYVLRQAVWQRTNDLIQKLLKDVEEPLCGDPTIHICDCEIPVLELRSLMKQAAALHVPVVCLEKHKSTANNTAAAGFEYYSADGPPAVLRLQWSYEIPSAWKPVMEWLQKLRTFLDSCIPEEGRRHQLIEPLPRWFVKWLETSG